MRAISAFLLVVLVAGFIEACKTKPASSDELAVFIQHKSDSLQQAEKLPGIFIAVSGNGKRSYFTAGYADPDRKTPFDSLTIFEIGSISKTFTAYVLEAVLKEKNISDSTSIINYLPDSVKTNKSLHGISFLSLLNHTSGLPRLPDNMDLTNNFMAPYDDYTATDLFSYLKTCTPQPDGHSNYSNLGAGLAGVLAQRITSRSYEDLLQEYIFKPFKITQHPDATIPGFDNKAQGYYTANKSPYWFADVLAPAGGLKCAASELLTYLENISRPGNDASQQIIDKLLEKTAEVAPRMNVCRAWHTFEQSEKPVIYWHNGGTYGFSTFAGFLKKEKKAVVIVINQFNKGQTSDRLGFTIMEKMMN